MNLNLTKEQRFYLCRMAALQFPGSVYNYSTKHPIHFLEERANVLLPLDMQDYTPEEMVLIEYHTQVNWNLYVVGIYGQLKYGHDGPYTNYIALQRGMQAVAKMAEEKHLPVYLPYGIGCGLAGGDWAVVKELIYRSLPKATIVQKQ